MTTIDEGVLIPTLRVRARYGDVSAMWIERRLKDDPDFPRPIYIRSRRYWRVSDLVAWDHVCAMRPVAKHVGFAARNTVAA
jgi:hypothetical protein